MKKILFTTVILCFSPLVLAQTPPQTANQTTVQAAKSNTAASAKPNIPVNKDPDGTIMTPKDIKYGDSKMQGDAQVLATYGDMAEIINNYNSESHSLTEKYDDSMKSLREKYLPLWLADQKKINDEIESVKKANKWGDDVIFNGNTKHWIKLTPAEYQKMKAAETNKK